MSPLASLILILVSSSSALAENSLSDFLQAAWKQSPIIASESHRNDESEHLVKSARGKYFPHVSLAAIDSTGFPASSSQLEVGGLMGSPFREGPAGGIVVHQTIYDFGRISSALEAAKASKSLNEARLAEEKLKFLINAGNLFIECARAQSLMEENERLASVAKLILKESSQFTKTGQRSIIDNALARSKLNGLELQHDELEKLKISLMDQMKLYSDKTECGSLTSTLVTSLPAELAVDDPSLLIAKAEVETSKASLENSKASQLPILSVMGSAGYMDRARVVEKQEYSASVGLVFPVWNGGEDQHREQAFRSQVEYRSQVLKAVRLEFEARTKNLTDQRNRSHETLQVLEKNLQQVRETMKFASDRYQSLEGPLIDVRDAYTELQAVESLRVGLLYSLAQTSLELALLKTR